MFTSRSDLDFDSKAFSLILFGPGRRKGEGGVKTSTFGTIAFNQFLPKRNRSAKDLFCSNTLSWSRNGARCISSISFGQKRSPKNEILV